MIAINHQVFMQRALELAREAASKDEVPVGAIIVFENEIIAEAINNRENAKNPVGHAELMAIELASKKLDRWRLTGCTLYVTLEPCVMCAGAIVLSRVDQVVFGTHDPKAGAVESIYQILADKKLNHSPVITTGVLQAECSQVLKDFFNKKRIEKAN